MNTLETLVNAITNTQQISFRYIKEWKNEGIRIGNPYAVFIFTAKNWEHSTKVHIVQTEWVSDSKEINPFPSFRMYNIEDLVEVKILIDRPKVQKPYHEDYKPESDYYKDVIKKI
jgi:hypothetical protein